MRDFKEGLRGIMVCVDYLDILQLTLPYNIIHFSDMMIVTGNRPQDLATCHYATILGCQVYQTDAFWRNGAKFNKWLALEEGLDIFGRHGWMCIMDADVAWPNGLRIWADDAKQKIWIDHTDNKESAIEYRLGNLITPLRRMMLNIPTLLPREAEWMKYPLHGNQGEWAGYTQIFHASDPVLEGLKYWHEVDWIHAGGADSFMQMKWSKENKIRPPFEVLHIGEAGRNWCGRNDEGRRELSKILSQRRMRTGPNRFVDEKIKHK